MFDWLHRYLVKTSSLANRGVSTCPNPQQCDTCCSQLVAVDWPLAEVTKILSLDLNQLCICVKHMSQKNRYDNEPFLCDTAHTRVRKQLHDLTSLSLTSASNGVPATGCSTETWIMVRLLPSILTSGRTRPELSPSSGRVKSTVYFSLPPYEVI